LLIVNKLIFEYPVVVIKWSLVTGEYSVIYVLLISAFAAFIKYSLAMVLFVTKRWFNVRLLVISIKFASLTVDLFTISNVVIVAFYAVIKCLLEIVLASILNVVIVTS
jgi:hypothetical protein